MHPERGRRLASLVLRKLLPLLVIRQDRDRLGVGDEFVQQPDEFAHQRIQREDAGYVAPWTVEA